VSRRKSAAAHDDTGAMTRSTPELSSLTRRATIGGLVAAPAILALPVEKSLAAAPGVCVLTPESVEGPFYFDPALVRSDITEGRVGAGLELRLTLLDVADCRPISEARIDVWHCDAAGAYSGFDQTAADDARSGKRATFLRGTQFSSADGVASFRTIYPGWYPGRTPHIHLKAFLNRSEILTTQVYFPDALSDRVYANIPAYRRKAKRDTNNTTDGILAGTRNARATFANLGESAGGYVATLTVAVDRRAQQGGRRRGPASSAPGR